MIQFRNGCFESNSSSVHTLIISKDTPAIFPNEISFRIGEFGWEFEEYENWNIEARASYFYTAACALYGYDVLSEIEEELRPYGVKVKHIYFNPPLFIIYEKDAQPYLDNGYVDHVVELKEFVNRCMKDSDYLIRWLFGATSRFYTDNDNKDMENIEFDSDIEEEYVKGN